MYITTTNTFYGKWLDKIAVIYHDKVSYEVTNISQSLFSFLLYCDGKSEISNDVYEQFYKQLPQAVKQNLNIYDHPVDFEDENHIFNNNYIEQASFFIYFDCDYCKKCIYNKTEVKTNFSEFMTFVDTFSSYGTKSFSFNTTYLSDELKPYIDYIYSKKLTHLINITSDKPYSNLKLLQYMIEKDCYLSLTIRYCPWIFGKTENELLPEVVSFFTQIKAYNNTNFKTMLSVIVSAELDIKNLYNNVKSLTDFIVFVTVEKNEYHSKILENIYDDFNYVDTEEEWLKFFEDLYNICLQNTSNNICEIQSDFVQCRKNLVNSIVSYTKIRARNIYSSTETHDLRKKRNTHITSLDISEECKNCTYLNKCKPYWNTKSFNEINENIKELSKCVFFKKGFFEKFNNLEKRYR
jgi:hypothetical protein